MQRTLSVICLLLFGVALCYAQKIKTVSASYTYTASEDIPLTQIRATAIERAKIQAIADEFGTTVSRINTTRIENDNGKSSVEYLSFGESEVKGEWIETLEEEVSSPVFHDKMIVVTATVKGRAREIVSVGVNFQAKILRNGTDKKYEDSRFRSGDELYLSFTSPVDGYLAVYLIDAAQQAYCLLPYRSQSDGIYKIEANRPYLFFNAKAASPTERPLVDEYVMTCDRSSERNLVCIVFSPNHFAKAADNITDEALPRCVGYKDFQRWLAKCRKKDKDMKLEQQMISITKE